MRNNITLSICIILLLTSCSTDDNTNSTNVDFDFSEYFTIDFNNLYNYASQSTPAYITKDNTFENQITNKGATLGRILFYDKNLSSNNTISCSSCHQQENAFSDTNSQSVGVNGLTGRHSMRLINSRFSNETNFFWDERATSLESQTTMPIQDHNEMGFSGTDGDQNFNDLIIKLNNVPYYPELFEFTFGSQLITEERIQNALAQFIRSIQSFDSKYDIGRTAAPNDNTPFTNFTTNENNGKQLFLTPPTFNVNGIRTSGGIGCAGCHQAPEFDIDTNSLNNGVIGTALGIGTDFEVTRSPSLRDVVKVNGESNGPFMHIGVSNNLATVIDHYNEITIAGNTNLDPRLTPGGNPQQLNMTQQEKDDVITFIRTLAGADVYINDKWSNPFIN
jgi:cytochrome c peroxidase